MKIKSIIVLAAVVFCVAGPIVGTFVYENYRTRDMTAEIIARSPEKGNFSPNTLTVPVGRTVKLRVRNNDTVAHGFAIPALKVDAGEIKAGHVAMLEFTPRQEGRYDYYCTVWCSESHMQMKGTLEVVRTAD